MLEMLRLIENQHRFDTVTEFSIFVETTKGIVDKLYLSDIGLFESTDKFMSSREIFEKAVAKSYRATRESLDAIGEFGRKQAEKAVLQARKLLFMKPQVLSANMEDIKALAIKQWNETLESCLKEQLLCEYGLARDTAEDTVKQYLGKAKPHEVKDKYTVDAVLSLGKATKRHHIKTAKSAYMVVQYVLKDKVYAAIEAPGKKPEVFH